MLRCKRQRILLELAQHQVAALTKGVVSQPTLSNIEKGRINPNDNELAALASVLNCPVNRLMDHVSDTVLGDGAEARDSSRREKRP